MKVSKLCALYRRGWSTHRLAKRAGLSSWDVWKKLRSEGVKIRPRQRKRRIARVDSMGYVTWGAKRVHRIVCEAWHGPPPTPDHEVNHIDGDKTNNHPENLEWVTHAENMRHAHDMGLAPPPPIHRGENQHCAKLTVEKVKEVRRLWKDGWTSYELAEKYGMSANSAWKAATGRSWKHVPMLDDEEAEK